MSCRILSRWCSSVLAASDSWSELAKRRGSIYHLRRPPFLMVSGSTAVRWWSTIFLPLRIRTRRTAHQEWKGVYLDVGSIIPFLPLVFSIDRRGGVAIACKPLNTCFKADLPIYFVAETNTAYWFFKHAMLQLQAYLFPILHAVSVCHPKPQNATAVFVSTMMALVIAAARGKRYQLRLQLSGIVRFIIPMANNNIIWNVLYHFFLSGSYLINKVDQIRASKITQKGEAVGR